MFRRIFSTRIEAKLREANNSNIATAIDKCRMRTKNLTVLKELKKAR